MDKLKISEVAAMVQVCERSIHLWTKQGIFPEPVWFGGRRYWYRADIEKYLATMPRGKSRPKNNT